MIMMMMMIIIIIMIIIMMIIKFINIYEKQWMTNQLYISFSIFIKKLSKFMIVMMVKNIYQIYNM